MLCLAYILDSCSAKLYPCPDISKVSVADLSGVLLADSMQTTNGNNTKETVPIENDFPFETGNTGIEKGSVPKVNNDVPDEDEETKNKKKVQLKDQNGLIKKKEPKKIHKVGKKNFIQKIIYAGKQQRKR